MRKRVLMAAAVILAARTAVPSTASAQVDTLPQSRAHAAMAYDAAGERVILTGGSTDGRTLGDTWSWDGTRWRQLPVGEHPRTSFALIFDRLRRAVMMVGGLGPGAPAPGNAPESDLWELRAEGWTPVRSAPIPARQSAAVAYDARRQRIVVFGGIGGDTVLGDTWEFDGDRWQLVGGDRGPAARSGAVMAYHAASGRTLLFGGRSASTDLGDTWSWDGASWTLVDTTGPVGRYGAAMVHDEARRELLLVGGVSNNFTKREASVWAWSGARWEARDSAGPPPRGLPAMAYDAKRRVVVLFGGRGAGRVDRNDTWEWDGHRWREALP